MMEEGRLPIVPFCLNEKKRDSRRGTGENYTVLGFGTEKAM
jgi:hypothetical protein